MSLRALATGLLAGIVGVASPGCATVSPQDPVATVQRYLELAADERIDAAYPLLSEPFRRRCDRSCLARLIASQRDEARSAVADLHAGSAAQLERTVELTLPDGTSLQLAQIGEAAAGPSSRSGSREPAAELTSSALAYQFSQNPLEFYPQSTPEETVRSFVRACNAKRYPALLRFVPKALAAQLTAEQLRQRFEGATGTGLQAQLTALQKHWSEPFQIDGTTARLPTGEGQEVRLVLEQGRWRIAQLQ